MASWATGAEEPAPLSLPQLPVAGFGSTVFSVSNLTPKARNKVLAAASLPAGSPINEEDQSWRTARPSCLL